MTERNEQLLMDAFPQLYPAPNHVLGISLFGCECDDGWLGILHGLFGALVATGLPIQLQQVKEKFGTLRVYCTHDGDDAVAALIDAAEARSAVTCEICGEPGQLYGKGGWVKTVCADHAAAWGATLVGGQCDTH